MSKRTLLDDLTAMPIEDLQYLAEIFEIPITPKTNRVTLIRKLHAYYADGPNPQEVTK